MIKKNINGYGVNLRTKVLEVVEEIGETVNIAEADVIVSGGRGLQEPKNFKLIEELAKANRRFVSFGIKTPSDYSAAGIQLAWDHIDFELSAKGSRFPVSAPLILRHNIYNALAALGAVSEEGFPLPEMIRRLADFRGVSGRMERIEEGQDFYVFVDYAHTPDGLFHVLSSLEALSRRRVISVFGCGGDRDP